MKTKVKTYKFAEIEKMLTEKVTTTGNCHIDYDKRFFPSLNSYVDALYTCNSFFLHAVLNCVNYPNYLRFFDNSIIRSLIEYKNHLDDEQMIEKIDNTILTVNIIEVTTLKEEVLVYEKLQALK